MELSWCKTLWGAVGAGTPHATLTGALAAATAEGWAGLAYAPIAHRFDPAAGPLSSVAEWCQAHHLRLVVMVHAWAPTLEGQLAELRRELEAVAPHRPHHVVCHAGRDCFDAATRRTFFAEVSRMERDLGLLLVHETHRGRPLYNPWVAREVLAEFPDLHLAVDLSHWVVVAERLLTEEDDVIRAAARQAVHVDMRVGHEQGPQVPDPSAPEWAEQVAAFTGWWQMILDEARRAGRDDLTIVPEYGPPPYQQVLGHGGGPTADLWATCRAERDRLHRVLR